MLYPMVLGQSQWYSQAKGMCVPLPWNCIGAGKLDSTEQSPVHHLLSDKLHWARWGLLQSVYQSGAYLSFIYESMARGSITEPFFKNKIKSNNLRRMKRN